MDRLKRFIATMVLCLTALFAYSQVWTAQDSLHLKKPNYIHKCTKLKICKIQYFIATLHKNSIYATRRFKHLHLEIERIT